MSEKRPDLDQLLDRGLDAWAASEPAPGLPERVLAQLRREPATTPAPRGRTRRWPWLVVAAAALLIAVGSTFLFRDAAPRVATEGVAPARPAPAVENVAKPGPPPEAAPPVRIAKGALPAVKRPMRKPRLSPPVREVFPTPSPLGRGGSASSSPTSLALRSKRWEEPPRVPRTPLQGESGRNRRRTDSKHQNRRRRPRRLRRARALPLAAQEAPAHPDHTRTSSSTSSSSSSGKGGTSFRLDYQIYELEGGKRVNERSYTQFVNEGGSGNLPRRLPRPDPPTSTTRRAQYMDVGLRINSRISEKEPGDVVLDADVDVSRLRHPRAGGSEGRPPSSGP